MLKLTHIFVVFFTMFSTLGCSLAPSEYVCEPGTSEKGRVCQEGIWKANDVGSFSDIPDQSTNNTTPRCGDGIVNGSEECDGSSLNNATCEKRKFVGGTLSCNSLCQFDTSNCEAPPTCGNKVIDTNEECDTKLPIETTCEDRGFDEGMISCNKACQFDTSKCSKCGNGIKEEGEECDGEVPSQLTCQTEGENSLGGKLKCDSSCKIDKTQCSECGNSIKEDGEECDGDDLDEMDCSSVKGIGNFGTLKCNKACQFVDVQCGLQFTEIHVSKSHSCALKSDQSIHCWGDNTHDRVTGNPTYPIPPKALSISIEEDHGCAVTPLANGKPGPIKCWGRNHKDQLDAPGGNFASVSVGVGYSCAIVDSTSDIVCWGVHRTDLTLGKFFMIDAGHNHMCGMRIDSKLRCWSTQNGRWSSEKSDIRTVSAGKGFTCAIKMNDTIKCQGAEKHGQQSSPPGSFHKISSGYFHACAINHINKAECWGWNKKGQTDVLDFEYSDLSAGYKHTCGIKKSDGSIVCWGDSTIFAGKPTL